jgi:hypothetical protein
MRDPIPEPRTAVMIVVGALWEDEKGILQRERARMENTSNSGACIRVTKQIDVGAKLRVQWRWEEFLGVARYCRKDGMDYLVGIQRDAKKSVAAKKAVVAGFPALESVKDVERNVLVPSVRPEQPPKQEESKPKEIAKQEAESVPIVTIERNVNQVSPPAGGRRQAAKKVPAFCGRKGLMKL